MSTWQQWCQRLRNWANDLWHSSAKRPPPTHSTLTRRQCSRVITPPAERQTRDPSPTSTPGLCNRSFLMRPFPSTPQVSGFTEIPSAHTGWAETGPSWDSPLPQWLLPLPLGHAIILHRLKAQWAARSPPSQQEPNVLVSHRRPPHGEDSLLAEKKMPILVRFMYQRRLDGSSHIQAADHRCKPFNL